MMQEQPQDTEWSQNETRPYEFQSELSKTIAEIRSQSADVSALMTALAKAQGQIGDIERDRTVKVQARSGPGYEFKYATLSAIIKGIKKALSDNGIAYTQVLTFETNDRLYYLTTSLHFENQFISSVTPLIIGGEAGNQQFGSALTYMKRYTLAALVGVAADEDDDGNAADGNEVQAMQEAVRKAKPPKAPVDDPITTSPVRLGPHPDIPAQEDHRLPYAERIEVPPMPNGQGSDWMTWGKTFMEHARAASTTEALMAFEEANSYPLGEMEKNAPRMYTNLSMSLIKVRNSLEKKNAE